jgi:hypothetical protein
MLEEEEKTEDANRSWKVSQVEIAGRYVQVTVRSYQLVT